MHEGDKKRIENYFWKERDHVGALGVDWRIILKRILNSYNNFGGRLDSTDTG
jgi:hypothetical protein